MQTVYRKIVETVVDMYVDDPTNLTPDAVCGRAGVDRGDFDRQFDDVNDAIGAWYAIAIDNVLEQAGAVGDFDSLSLQDRLGTFCFLLLDQLEDRLVFARSTYRHHAACFSCPFHRRLRGALSRVLSGPDVPGVNYLLVDTDAARFVVAESIVQMIHIWLHDESPDRERATALIDRVLALVAEIMTNRVPDKTADLVRYAVEAGYLPLDRLPVIGDMFEKPERR